MAQEISISSTLSVKKGTLSLSYPVTGTKADQAGIGGVLRQQSIPTTAGGTTIDMTGVAAPGWILITNKDPTNYVQVGPNNAGSILAMCRLKPGEQAGPFRIDGTLRALANTAACIIEYLVIEA